MHRSKKNQCRGRISRRNYKKESTKATEKRINALIIALSKSDRMEDIIKAAKDHDYQQNLFKEFGL